jgi:hypothetical protein
MTATLAGPTIVYGVCFVLYNAEGRGVVNTGVGPPRVPVTGQVPREAHQKPMPKFLIPTIEGLASAGSEIFTTEWHRLLLMSI